MSQTFANYNAYLRYKNINSKSWTTTGNTDTVTDEGVKSNSFILIQHTAAPAGTWYITVNPSGGSFVVTSSDSESAGLTYNYFIL